MKMLFEGAEYDPRKPETSTVRFPNFLAYLVLVLFAYIIYVIIIVFLTETLTVSGNLDLANLIGYIIPMLILFIVIFVVLYQSYMFISKGESEGYDLEFYIRNYTFAGNTFNVDGTLNKNNDKQQLLDNLFKDWMRKSSAKGTYSTSNWGILDDTDGKTLVTGTNITPMEIAYRNKQNTIPTVNKNFNTNYIIVDGSNVHLLHEESSDVATAREIYFKLKSETGLTVSPDVMSNYVVSTPTTEEFGIVSGFTGFEPFSNYSKY
tara:strand:- start:8563 stop:9351 length:789 start_codon:yes stop_codon:yes gene_type:complete